MCAITLNSPQNFFKLLENASERKRRLPATSNLRTTKESRRHIGQDAVVTCVEPHDLARFEGEGGLAAPETAAARR